MNINELQSAWEQQPNNDNPIDENILTVRKAAQPLDKIRKTFKNDFYAGAVLFIALAFYPLIKKIQAPYLISYYILYGIMILVSLYYLIRFHFFYKRLSAGNLNSMHNLYALYYDIRLNMEIYKAWIYHVAPFGLFFALLLNINKGDKDLLSVVLQPGSIIIIVSFVIMAPIVTELWIKLLYGKYIKQIKALVDQLEE